MRAVPLLLLAGLLVGCGTSPELVLGPPPGHALGPELQVLPQLLAYRPTPILPVDRAQPPHLPGSYVCLECEEAAWQTAAPLPPCPECGEARWRQAFEAPFRPALSGVAGRVAALLGERGDFPRVRGPGDLGQADWRLRLTLTRAEVTLSGRNWLYPVKWVVLVASSLLIFPAVDPPNWFLADELYALEAELAWRLEDGSGAALREGTLTHRVVEPFAAWGLGVPSRGWFLIGFVRTPGCLEPEDWDEIARQLEGRGSEELARAVVAALEAALADAPASAQLRDEAAPPRGAEDAQRSESR